MIRSTLGCLALVVATPHLACSQELSSRHQKALADTLARYEFGVEWSEAPQVTVVTRNTAVIRGSRQTGRGTRSDRLWVAVVERIDGEWVVVETLTTTSTPMPTPTPTPTPAPTPTPSPSPSPSPSLSPSPHGMWFGGPFASASELPVRDGALVIVGVADGSQAASMGIRAGDRIVAINGKSVGDYDKRELLRNLSDRRFARATFTRNGTTLIKVFQER